MKSWNDTIVFVSGATSGIGRACAARFAAAGCRLVLCARRGDLLEEAAAELRAHHKVEVHTMVLDVGRRADVERLLPPLLEKYPVDILVNNAGGAKGMEKLQEGAVDDWDFMIDVNVKGLLYVTRQILPGMVRRNSGHIINIGSIAGQAAYPGGAVYCGAKAAVKLISDGLRMDVVNTAVRVTNIAPGLVETDFSLVRFHGDRERAAKVYQGIHALRAEDVAESVWFAAQAPAHVHIHEIVVTPTHQASALVLHRT